MKKPWILLAILLLVTGGCKKRSTNLGAPNWIPQSVGGPIEIRPLPAASELTADYKLWLESETTPKVRLYEAVLHGATNQLHFKVKVQQGRTPVGSRYATIVDFIYLDPTNGQYLLVWKEIGKHDPTFLKLSELPKKVLLMPIGIADSNPIPRLEIRAFEGLEAKHVEIAQ